MMFNRRGFVRVCRGALLTAAAVPVMAATGCGDGRPPRVTVAGKVLIDGAPLTQGNILFVPEGGRPSTAQIGPDGSFELRCFEEDDGALLGTHQVSVSAKTIVSENNIRWHAPARYANHLTSGLTVEVTESVDDLVIELTSKDPNRRGRR